MDDVVIGKLDSKSIRKQLNPYYVVFVVFLGMSTIPQSGSPPKSPTGYKRPLRERRKNLEGRVQFDLLVCHLKR